MNESTPPLFGPGGGITLTKANMKEQDKVSFIRLITTIQAIKIHLQTGGKMRMTRMATPSRLRQIATEYTGKPYARSKKALEQALADLTAVKEKALAPV